MTIPDPTSMSDSKWVKDAKFLRDPINNYNEISTKTKPPNLFYMVNGEAISVFSVLPGRPLVGVLPTKLLNSLKSAPSRDKHPISVPPSQTEHAGAEIICSTAFYGALEEGEDPTEGIVFCALNNNHTPPKQSPFSIDPIVPNHDASRSINIWLWLIFEEKALQLCENCILAPGEQIIYVGLVKFGTTPDNGGWKLLIINGWGEISMRILHHIPIDTPAEQSKDIDSEGNHAEHLSRDSRRFNFKVIDPNSASTSEEGKEALGIEFSICSLSVTKSISFVHLQRINDHQVVIFVGEGPSESTEDYDIDNHHKEANHTSHYKANEMSWSAHLVDIEGSVAPLGQTSKSLNHEGRAVRISTSLYQNTSPPLLNVVIGYESGTVYLSQYLSDTFQPVRSIPLKSDRDSLPINIEALYVHSNDESTLDALVSCIYREDDSNDLKIMAWTVQDTLIDMITSQSLSSLLPENAIINDVFMNDRLDILLLSQGLLLHDTPLTTIPSLSTFTQISSRVNWTDPNVVSKEMATAAMGINSEVDTFEFARWFDISHSAGPASTPPYTWEHIQRIEGMKSGSFLFIDLIFKQLAAEKVFNYPPHSWSDLGMLVEEIKSSPAESSINSHQPALTQWPQFAALLYLLLDASVHPFLSNSQNRISSFARIYKLPADQVALIRAYWCLDNNKLEEAVSLLCSMQQQPFSISSVSLTNEKDSINPDLSLWWPLNIFEKIAPNYALLLQLWDNSPLKESTLSESLILNILANLDCCSIAEGFFRLRNQLAMDEELSRDSKAYYQLFERFVHSILQTKQQLGMSGNRAQLSLVNFPVTFPLESAWMIKALSNYETFQDSLGLETLLLWYLWRSHFVNACETYQRIKRKQSFTNNNRDHPFSSLRPFLQNEPTFPTSISPALLESIINNLEMIINYNSNDTKDLVNTEELDMRIPPLSSPRPLSKSFSPNTPMKSLAKRRKEDSPPAMPLSTRTESTHSVSHLPEIVKSPTPFSPSIASSINIEIVKGSSPTKLRPCLLSSVGHSSTQHQKHPLFLATPKHHPAVKPSRLANIAATGSLSLLPSPNGDVPGVLSNTSSIVESPLSITHQSPLEGSKFLQITSTNNAKQAIESTTQNADDSTSIPPNTPTPRKQKSRMAGKTSVIETRSQSSHKKRDRINTRLSQKPSIERGIGQSTTTTNDKDSLPFRIITSSKKNSSLQSSQLTNKNKASDTPILRTPTKRALNQASQQSDAAKQMGMLTPKSKKAGSSKSLSSRVSTSAVRHSPRFGKGGTRKD